MLKLLHIPLIGLALTSSLLLSATVFAREKPVDPVNLDLQANSRYILTEETQRIPIKISLTGLMPAKQVDRAPVNIAIVMDRSSSMSGRKIQDAREGAIAALRRLGSQDVASVVVYDDRVDTIVPATRLTNFEEVASTIRAVQPRGSTALFAGVSKGASEVRKFFNTGSVNRVILLSDGMANIGPSSPGELGNLGASFARDGISVTTLGIGSGYNEDLMAQLATRSDGNHAFVENSTELASYFNKELGDVLSVVAQDVNIKFTCGKGVRPIRVLGRDADINGQVVTTSLNQIYNEQEKYILLEVEVDNPDKEQSTYIGKADISYRGMFGEERLIQQRSLALLPTANKALIDREAVKKTVVAYYTQLANENSVLAVKLRDSGQSKKAQELVKKNQTMLEKTSKAYNSPKLKSQAELYEKQVTDWDSVPWGSQRKKWRHNQNTIQSQQSF